MRFLYLAHAGIYIKDVLVPNIMYIITPSCLRYATLSAFRHYKLNHMERKDESLHINHRKMTVEMKMHCHHLDHWVPLSFQLHKPHACTHAAAVLMRRSQKYSVLHWCWARRCSSAVQRTWKESDKQVPMVLALHCSPACTPKCLGMVSSDSKTIHHWWWGVFSWGTAYTWFTTTQDADAIKVRVRNVEVRVR